MLHISGSHLGTAATLWRVLARNYNYDKKPGMKPEDIQHVSRVAKFWNHMPYPQVSYQVFYPVSCASFLGRMQVESGGFHGHSYTSVLH
jgi:hypothetical protein